MKWFKHISDSLDDPFIFELMTLFGGDGYLVFFGVLEIYSREFKTEPGWKLKVTRAYLRQKLQKRQDTLIMNCLKHIQNSGKWQVDFIGQQVIIFIPKFTEIIDEWTSRKLVSKSGVAPEILSVKQKQSKIQNKDKSIPADISTETIEPKKQLVLEKLKETMLKFPDSRYQRSIELFVQANWNKNDDAIIHCLSQLINSKKPISYPKSYLEKVLGIENGNFNERESMQEHATHKADIPVQDIPRLGEVLKVMAGGK